MDVRYYAPSDVLVIEFSTKPVARTKDIGDLIIVDFDADGMIRDIEIVGAKERGLTADNIQFQIVTDESQPATPEEAEAVRILIERQAAQKKTPAS